MKHKILATLLLASTVTLADESKELSPFEACAKHSELAELIMQLRQDNADMVAMYEAVKDDDVAIAMLNIAYDTPAYSLESNKRNEVAEFKNDIFRACMKKYAGEIK